MEANLALPAVLIGDPVRAAILSTLCDGRAQPAGALACAARVSPQCASNHLAKLTPGGTDSEVGIAGLSLGGGNGWLMERQNRMPASHGWSVTAGRTGKTSGGQRDNSDQDGSPKGETRR